MVTLGTRFRVAQKLKFNKTSVTNFQLIVLLIWSQYILKAVYLILLHSVLLELCQQKINMYALCTDDTPSEKLQ